jgi:hypothetical protein
MDVLKNVIDEPTNRPERELSPVTLALARAALLTGR